MNLGLRELLAGDPLGRAALQVRQWAEHDRFRQLIGGMTRARTFLLIVGGTISVAVGIVGVFVPLLPTTPFLLLAAFLYARGSKRLYKWLLGNRLVGNYLRRYYERRCMTRRHKVVTLTLLWAVIVLSAALAADSWWVRGVLGGVAVAVTTHIFLLPGERDRSEVSDS